MPVPLTFNFELRNEANVLVDPIVPPVLSDDVPATYGIKDEVLGTVFVAAGTAVTKDGVGLYHYTWNDAIADRTYRVSWKYDVGSGPQFLSYVKIAGAAEDDPTSRYTTYARFIRKFGTQNVIQATNKENNAKEVNKTLVQDAFDFADNEIDSELRGSIYAVPLDFTPWAGAVPYDIVNSTNILAFEYCYESKGFEEKNNIRNKMKLMESEAYRILGRIRTGIRQINAKLATATSGAEISGSAVTVNSDRLVYRFPDGHWIVGS